MLKKLLAAVVCLPFALAGYAAQLTATLQSGDNFTPFYGANAFVDAYNAAVDGDVITLSPGTFTPANIEKSVAIIGAGGFWGNIAECTTFSSATVVSSDNVFLEGIYFTYALTIKGADNLSISRCRIQTLQDAEKEGHKYHENTIITGCIIENCYSMDLSKGAVFRNSCINFFFDLNEESNVALVENCNVVVIRSSVSGVKPVFPYAIYRNCFLGVRGSTALTITIEAPYELYDNIFYEANYGSSDNISVYLNCIGNNNVIRKMYNITSLAGMPTYGSLDSYTYNDISYGPQAPRKYYPSIPSITASEIDTETDENGNLHVKITATARD